LTAGDGSLPAKKVVWHRWIEPWFLAYALLGAAVGGLAPILLPLSVGAGGSVAEIGLVVGAFNLGGLSSPLWGGLADRRGLGRSFLLGGLLVAGLSLAAFPLATSLAIRLALALAQGIGAACAATVASTVIVETHPRVEWDERIGWLQTFYGGGQVLGLLLAGVVSGPDLRRGFFLAGGLLIAASPAAMFMKRMHRKERPSRPVVNMPSRHAELTAGSPQSFYHHPNAKALGHFFRSAVSPFHLFLLAWFVSFTGVAAFFSLYPVVMGRMFGIAPSLSSIGFAAAATAGLFLYAPAGVWSRKFGSMRILRTALVVRSLAFVALFVLGDLTGPHTGALPIVGFAFVVLAWSLLSVTGTEITARLSEDHEGEGLGLFNAGTAAAGVLGALVGGWSAGVWGYHVVALLGIIGATAGLFLTGLVSIGGKQSKTKE
jgi:DHA1 family tetracycline resistance protein-like MFS transporter